MIWFLRWFSAFSAMESLLLATAQERNRMAEELAEAHARNRNLLDRVAESHTSEIQATRKFVDFVAQQKFGRSVFDVAAEIPVPPESMKPITITKRHAEDLARELNDKFFASLEFQPDTAETVAQ